MKKHSFSLPLKVVLYQIVFLVLHFLYAWMPNSITRIISGTDESIFQHMKIGFFSYLIVVAIEFFCFSIATVTKKTFLFSRMFTTVLIPFLLMLFFLVSPLIFIRIESITGEILFANIALLCSSLTAFIVEEQIAKTVPSNGFMATVSILFVIACVEFIVFTNRLPWVDVFANPSGW